MNPRDKIMFDALCEAGNALNLLLSGEVIVSEDLEIILSDMTDALALAPEEVKDVSVMPSWAVDQCGESCSLH